MHIKKSWLMISAAIALSSVAHATPSTSIVIAPQCLLKAAHFKFTTLAEQQSIKLIEMNDTDIEKLSLAKTKTKSSCGGFTDVTRAWSLQTVTQISPQEFLADYITPNPDNHPIKTEYKIQYEKETQAMLKTIDTDNMWNYLIKLTDIKEFRDRFANSQDGVKAANWIKFEVEEMAKKTGHDDVTVYLVSTGRYSQPSVVAKFGNSDLPGIVIGAHMDTLNSEKTGHKPGADDDGSGTVTVLETARTILASGTSFQKPIYFIWYSAEELGLVGSDYTVADFTKKNIPVETAIQFDMTGYAPNYQLDPTMYLMTDYVNADLTNYLKSLIKTYVQKPYKTSRCGYGCSDHASWHKAGVAAAFPFEAPMNNDNPNIHKTSDKMGVLSKQHMEDYLKLAVAYVVEMAAPVTKNNQ
jgi:leucyl aminopeptidase